MPNVIDELIDRTKEEHEAVDSQPFLRRYFKEDSDLVVEDHYRQLCQLLPLYQALETQVKDIKGLPVLPAELAFLLERSQAIEADMRFLEAQIPDERKRLVLPVTQAYIDQVNKMSPATHGIEIWGHFLTRILADLYGGRKTKQYLEWMYQRQGVNTESDDADSGLNFYCFGPGTLRRLKAWLNENQSHFTADALMPHFSSSYANHIKIFALLEDTRPKMAIRLNVAGRIEKPRVVEGESQCPMGFGKDTGTENDQTVAATPPKKSCPYKTATQNFCNLFTPRNIGYALGAGVAAAASLYVMRGPGQS